MLRINVAFQSVESRGNEVLVMKTRIVLSGLMTAYGVAKIIGVPVYSYRKASTGLNPAARLAG